MEYIITRAQNGDTAIIREDGWIAARIGGVWSENYWETEDMDLVENAELAKVLYDEAVAVLGD